MWSALEDISSSSFFILYSLLGGCILSKAIDADRPHMAAFETDWSTDFPSLPTEGDCLPCKGSAVPD